MLFSVRRHSYGNHDSKFPAAFITDTVHTAVVRGFASAFLAKHIDIALAFNQFSVGNGAIQRFIGKFLRKNLKEFFAYLLDGVCIIIRRKHRHIIPPPEPYGLTTARILAGKIQAQPETSRLISQIHCVFVVQDRPVLRKKLIPVYSAETFDYGKPVIFIIIPELKKRLRNNCRR